MDAFTTHTGRAVPLRRSDVDTDQIIPSDWLKRVERTGFGRGLFSQWREDPSFVLNAAQHAGASILVAGENFGTGSSREHAVWALQDFGFRAVVSPRFADIFRSNALKGGLVPVQLDAPVVEQLMALVEQRPDLPVTVDLGARELRAADLVAPFPLDDFTRWRLMEGLDDIGLTLRAEPEIASYEAVRAAHLPTTTVGSR
ncbi:MAG: 3-isopropylmalate dehydratase, small subunit [Frankiales bacterium]|jgi:3-isopropylmalate/(R)-2-methylmalate dehydratase small subunit|nr:3-isopropylmalate dehydratase, small subunit [Frankiales bacterium]